MAEILFFTCADQRYESFAPLYACGALHHVADSIVEIGVESVEHFTRDNAGALRVLSEHFPNRIHVRPADFSRSPPHTVRFVTEPQRRARYTYIGDIDILILERDLVAQHGALMKRWGLPYSNVTRPHDRGVRLSGLHFAETERLYPLPDVSDLDLMRIPDECILCEVVRRKGMPIATETGPRPVHGIHMSPSRPAVSATGQTDSKGRPMPDWGLDKWRGAYTAFAESEPFQALRSHLSGLAAESIATIERAYGLIEPDDSPHASERRDEPEQFACTRCRAMYFARPSANAALCPGCRVT